MKRDHVRGIGSRFDPLTPNAIDRARVTAPGMGLPLGGKRWCVKCQQDKPIEGSVKRNGMVLCGDCK